MPKVKLFDEGLILKKAMELFWKKGFYATSIQDLVDHLGISRSSIYDTYGGKHQLFLKAFQLYRTTFVTAFSNFLDEQADIKEGLKKVFEMAIIESVTDVDHKGCFVVNATTELIPGDKTIEGIIEKNKETVTHLFYDFLQKGQKGGVISKDKDLWAMANLYFTLYNGIKVVSKVKPNPEDLRKSIDIALSLLD